MSFRLSRSPSAESEARLARLERVVARYGHGSSQSTRGTGVLLRTMDDSGFRAYSPRSGAR